jgi:mono/diheme cytochrome c family protein
MQFHQRFVPGLAIASYIIGDAKSGEAAVIDPTRDVDDFIAFAKNNDLHIKHIIETHVHADFVCGSRELKARLNDEPTIHCSGYGGKDWTQTFADEHVKEGDTIEMGDVRFGFQHVPPLSIDPKQADLKRGKTLFAQKCADCHGKKRQGTDEGPPTWGPQSYNDGAGLSRHDKLAAWLKVAMPLGDPSLSEQEALDIASFTNSHERPKFVLEKHLPRTENLGEYNAESQQPQNRKSIPRKEGTKK